MQDLRSRSGKIAGYVLYPFWFILLVMVLFTDLVVAGHHSLIPFQYTAGPFENPARIVGGILLIWMILQFRRVKETVTGIKKVQLSYLYFGTLIFGGCAAFLAAFYQVYSGRGVDPALASFFSFPWVVFTVYSITRHRLFDIRIVVSRTLGILMVSIIVAVVHTILFQLLEPEFGHVYAILISLAIIGFVFLGTSISRNILQWVAHLILMRKYDYQLLLKEAIRTISVKLDLLELQSSLIESTQKSMGIASAALYLNGEKGLQKAQEGFSPRLTTGVAPVLAAEHVGWIEGAARAISKEELVAGTTGERGCRQCLEFMEAQGAELIIPLLFNGRMTGLLALGPKESGEHFDRSDLDLLESLAGHAAVALENARLHEESMYHYRARLEEEKRHLKEKETLIRNLHDGIGSIMTSIGAVAETSLRKPLDKEVADRLSTIAALSHEGMSEARMYIPNPAIEKYPDQ